MDYYNRFQLITHLFFFRKLISSAYARGIKDLKKLGIEADFNKPGFTCLLSGVGGEITAELYIEFVIARNKKAKMVIIDLGEQQVASVKHLVEQKYKGYDITVKRMNVLDIEKNFAAKTFDWIETDGLIEYLDKPQLKSLLRQWKQVLKPDGFITTRDFASNSPFGALVDKFRMWFIKKHLTLTGHVHTKKQLDEIFAQAGFRFVTGPTPVPTFKRYALVAKA